MKVGVQPKHRPFCRRLLQAGTLPRSACGPSVVRALKLLFDSDILRWEKSAGGQKLAVVNRQAFERWISHHFPIVELQDGIDSSCIQAVAQFRDTKTLRSNLPKIICLRSVNDGVLLRDGAPVETTRATKEHGAFEFTLTRSTAYTLQGACALIENLAVFQSFEHLGLGPEMAIWTSGKSSNLFIDWLAVNVKNGLRVLHLPDYDPVGLTEFLRHHERLGEAVTLFLPHNLPSLFRHHSNAKLLALPKSQRMLMELRKARHPAVQQVVALIDEHNGGLEHQALFILPCHSTETK
jgi:hypothetical protein